MNDKTLVFNEVKSTSPIDDAPVRVLQWKYSACPYNVDRINGFATFSKSDGLSDADVADLRDALGHYVAPEKSPLQPTAEDLRDHSKFPVAFSSLKLKSGRQVIARTCAVGRDYGGARYGNFFVHALILENGDRFDALRYFDSPTFAKRLTDEEINLGRTPEPLPTLDLKDVVPNNFVFKTRFADYADPKIVRYRRALVDAVLKSLRDDKRTVVAGNLGDAAQLVAWTLASFPPEIVSRIEFTTYSGAPLDETRPGENNDVVLTFTTNDVAARLERSNRAAIVRSENTLESRFAEALSDEFLSFIARFDFSFAARLPKDKLFDVLEGVATLFFALRGRLAPENVDACRSFLTTQTATVCAGLAPDFGAASEETRDFFWNGWLELPKRERRALYDSFLRLGPDEAKAVGERALALPPKVRAELWTFLSQFVEGLTDEIVASFDEIDAERAARFWRFFNASETIRAEFQDFLSQAPRNVVERFYSRVLDCETFTINDVKTLVGDCVKFLDAGVENEAFLIGALDSAFRTGEFQEKIVAFWARSLQDDAPALIRRELLLNDFADVFDSFGGAKVSRAKSFLQLFQNVETKVTYERSSALKRFTRTLELYVDAFDGKSPNEALSTFDERLSLLEDGRRFLFGRLQRNIND